MKIFFKIFFVLITLLTATLFVTSCNNIGTDRSENTAATGTMYGDIDLKPFTINNYSDYRDFLANSELKDDFIEYSEIKSLGTFNRYQCSDFWANRKYNYSVTDENGCNITIYVKNDYIYDGYEGSNYPVETIEAPTNDPDLRNIENDHLMSIFIVNGYEYFYFSGELHHISKISGNTYFCISSAADRLYEYPLDKKENLITKLLNTDTMYDALSELDEMIS